MREHHDRRAIAFVFYNETATVHGCDAEHREVRCRDKLCAGAHRIPGAGEVDVIGEVGGQWLDRDSSISERIELAVRETHRETRLALRGARLEQRYESFRLRVGQGP